MLVNKSTGKKIIKERVRKDFLGQAFGLMLKKKHDYALIFEFKNERRISLTMWFVNFPIDVLWLDKHKRVVEIKKDFKPWANYTPKHHAKYVIELPEGYGYKFKVNDFVDWK
jgi:uncharacterized membrane protein (UPF0127 family)